MPSPTMYNSSDTQHTVETCRHPIFASAPQLPPDYLVSQKEIDDANDELDIGSYLLPGGQSAPLPDMDSPPHRTAEPSAIFSAHDTDDDDFQEASPSQRGHSGSQFRGTAPSHSGVPAPGSFLLRTIVFVAMSSLQRVVLERCFEADAA